MIENPDKLQGLQPHFREWVLEFARFVERNYGFNLFITSGYRSEEENRRVGGVPNSAHLKGLAVDIRIRSGKERFYLIDAAIRFGFKRIGVGWFHIHLDMDFSKPYPTIFPDT